MILKKQLLLSTLIWFCATSGFADSLRISQVDSSDLLLRQEIRLYLSVTDNNGIPIKQLKQSNFEIEESSTGVIFSPVNDITGFRAGINDSNDVSFLLLLDNSESMYWTLEGDKTNDDSQRRMTIAKKAVKAFLQSVTNPADKVGIAVYNSYYQLLSRPSNDIREAGQQLDSIIRPDGDAIYSEIYASLSLAIEEFETVKGRKAIIILSDGVNNPAYAHTKKINDQFGTKFVPYTTPLEQMQLEGISLYVINFGEKSEKKDIDLKTIAQQSGGVTFDAHSEKQLNQVYAGIMDQVQNEYIVAYRATMDAADRKHVKVNYKKDNQVEKAFRTYLSSSVFGLPSSAYSPLFLVCILISAFLLWLLAKLKFERQRRSPSIEILNAGTSRISTQVLTLGSGETIIGSSPKADMTIAGLPAVEENHATIIFNASTKTYALKSNGKMMVNNQLVTTKILEPGDLINIDGATMVFDEGTDK